MAQAHEIFIPYVCAFSIFKEMIFSKFMQKKQICGQILLFFYLKAADLLVFFEIHTLRYDEKYKPFPRQEKTVKTVLKSVFSTYLYMASFSPQIEVFEKNSQK